MRSNWKHKLFVLAVGIVMVAAIIRSWPRKRWTIMCDHKGHYTFTTWRGSLFGGDFTNRAEAEATMKVYREGFEQPTPKPVERNWQYCDR